MMPPVVQLLIENYLLLFRQCQYPMKSSQSKIPQQILDCLIPPKQFCLD
jgi:hypothetical protein